MHHALSDCGVIGLIRLYAARGLPMASHVELDHHSKLTVGVYLQKQSGKKTE